MIFYAFFSLGLFISGSGAATATLETETTKESSKPVIQPDDNPSDEAITERTQGGISKAGNNLKASHLESDYGSDSIDPHSRDNESDENVDDAADSSEVSEPIGDNHASISEEKQDHNPANTEPTEESASQLEGGEHEVSDAHRDTAGIADSEHDKSASSSPEFDTDEIRSHSSHEDESILDDNYEHHKAPSSEESYSEPHVLHSDPPSYHDDIAQHGEYDTINIPQMEIPRPVYLSKESEPFIETPGHHAERLVPEALAVQAETPTFEERYIKSERALVRSNPLSQVLAELYGDSIEWFGNDEIPERDIFSLVLNCNNPKNDLDYKVNLVTTLCPFIRSSDNSPCGTVRKASYQFDDQKKLCSKECLPHLNAVLEALRRKESLTHGHELAVFRDISNHILLQYAGLCRLGAAPKLEN